MFSFFEYTKEQREGKKGGGRDPYHYGHDFEPIGPIMFKSPLRTW